MSEADRIPDGICVVCGHRLDNHIDEGDVWRCHCLGQDWYQCECALRKGRVLNEGDPDEIGQYDLKRRLLSNSEALETLSELLEPDRKEAEVA